MRCEMPSNDLFPEYPNVVALLETRAQQYTDKVAFYFLNAANASQQSRSLQKNQAYINIEETKQKANQSASCSEMTYGQMWQQAIAIAATLQSKQAYGERVLIIQKPGFNFITAYLGCLCAGAIAVPAYPPRNNHHFERLQSILSNAEANLVLTTQQNIDSFQSQAQNWPMLAHATWIASDNVQIDLAQQWQRPNIPSDSLAMLQYTSGSTGRPKGVMIQHRHLLHNAFLIHECFQTHGASEATSVCWLPPYHDMGLIGGILQPINMGSSTALMDPVAFLQRPIRWLEAIDRYRAVISGGPNFAYALCNQAIAIEDCANFDLSCWKTAFIGAEPIKAKVIEQFAKKFAPIGFSERSFLPCYGMAEATLMVTGRNGLHTKRVDTAALRDHRVIEALPNELNADKTNLLQRSEMLVSCGFPISDVQVKVVNPHTDAPCTPNQIGEIWVNSNSVAAGYWRSPELTEQTFIDAAHSPRFLRTGDMGFLDNGELYITGRLKELMIIRGQNFYPQDIEQAVQASYVGLRANSGAAFTVSHSDKGLKENSDDSVDENGDEALVIVQEVERTALRKLDKEAAIKAIRRAVAEQFELQTAAIVLVKPAQLPKTTSGKIQRLRCREKFLDRSLTVVHSWSILPDDLSSVSAASQPTAQASTHIQSGDRNINQGSTQSLKVEQVLEQQRIQTWLLERISTHLKVNIDQIKLNEPLADYGLSSLIAVRLSGELQDWLEQPLDPTLLYDYPSIAALSEALAQRKVATGSDAEGLPSNHMAFPGYPQRRYADDDIAVIGIGCRFPGAATLADYWQLLLNGDDAIQTVPSDRWDINAYYEAEPGTAGKMTTRWGGFIEEVDRFDAGFFSISPREAASMDPQQRLLLEVTWETLEQAGKVPSVLKGSKTGVFVGMSSNDYSRLKLKQQLPPSAYFGTSHALSIASNRISYVMDWRGPSVTVDTACSSSLVAIHQACQSLRMRDCDLAIAGGVNLMLDPDLSVVFSQAQMMAADGRCKTFDAAADGYVRGEGCGLVLLKPLSAALREGDSIFGVIKGSAVNQDGRSNGLTAPNAQSQQAVITQALKSARLRPDQISYIEAHGTGTALGDPIEVNAIKAVFEPGRSRQNPLFLGSAKTNIGHLESAAGIAGFIKVLLSLHHRVMVPTLHCQKVNPLIDIETSPLAIAQERRTWPAQADPLYHGVSSFGFGGTNAHIVLGEAPNSSRTLSAHLPSSSASQAISQRTKEERPYHLLTLSAKTSAALQAQVDRYRQFVVDSPDISIGDLCFTANAARARLPHRISLVVQSRDDLLNQLASLDVQQQEYRPPATAAQRAFFFSERGNPWRMGAQLYETQPQFRAWLDRCGEILQPIWQRSLTSLLYTDADGKLLLQDPYYARPALFALQYAIANIWMSWGVAPTVAIGDELGRAIAACVSGTMDLRVGLEWAAQREQALQALSTDNQRNAILEEEDRLLDKLINQSAGHELKVITLVANKGLVPADRASSYQTSNYQTVESDDADEIAQLAIALEETLMTTGCSICFEMVAGSLPLSTAEKLTIIPAIGTTRDLKTADLRTADIRTAPDWQVLFDGLMLLDRLGVSLRWHEVDCHYGERLSNLPTYPFQRQRHWFQSRSADSTVASAGAATSEIADLEKTDLEKANLEKANSKIAEPIQVQAEAKNIRTTNLNLASKNSTSSNGTSNATSSNGAPNSTTIQPNTYSFEPLPVAEDSLQTQQTQLISDVSDSFEQVINSQLDTLETLMTQQLIALESVAGDIALSEAAITPSSKTASWPNLSQAKELHARGSQSMDRSVIEDAYTQSQSSLTTRQRSPL